MFYAVINSNGICETIKMTNGIIDSPDHIEIPDLGDYMNRKYENGQWSAKKYEPQTTASLTRFIMELPNLIKRKK